MLKASCAANQFGDFHLDRKCSPSFPPLTYPNDRLHTSWQDSAAQTGWAKQQGFVQKGAGMTWRFLAASLRGSPTPPATLLLLLEKWSSRIAGLPQPAESTRRQPSCDPVVTSQRWSRCSLHVANTLGSLHHDVLNLEHILQLHMAQTFSMIIGLGLLFPLCLNTIGHDAPLERHGVSQINNKKLIVHDAKSSMKMAAHAGKRTTVLNQERFWIVSTGEEQDSKWRKWLKSLIASCSDSAVCSPTCPAFLPDSAP